MGVLDFLFEGNPPPSVTTYGSSTSNLPQWLSDYTQALITKANATAGEAYTPYQGPRVAGLNSDQTNAFDLVRNNVGGWNDEMEQAESQNAGALTQSMPYLQQAGQSTPDAITRGGYLNPYTDNVIARGTLEANRNYNENILPGLEDRFTRNGQSGSTAHYREADRASRDLTEGVQSQAMEALAKGWDTAGAQYQNDAARNLQLGSTIGNLNLDASKNSADLAAGRQRMAGLDAAGLNAIGETEQQQTQKNLDTAYGDFQNQLNYPKEQLAFLQSMIQGVPHDSTSTTTGTAPASAVGPSPLAQFLALYGAYKDVKGDGKAQGGLILEPLAPLDHYAAGGRVDHPGPTQQLARFGHYARGIKQARARRDHQVKQAFNYARGGLACLEQ